jgi:hypothetical protein
MTRSHVPCRASLLQADEAHAEAQRRWQGACNCAAAASSDEAEAADSLAADHKVRTLLSGMVTCWERTGLHVVPGCIPAAPFPTAY